MRGRHRINRKDSRRSFTKGALRVHKKNVVANPMRGGIRL